jgi:hypothetical protein
MWKLVLVMLVAVAANAVLAAEASGPIPNVQLPKEGSLAEAAAREVRRSRLLPASLPVVAPAPQAGQPKRSWMGRHPTVAGTLIGLGAGFLIGWVPGDDGVFDDFVAEFNGIVVGGIGAGAGAAVGAGIGALMK